ncbi:ADP-ribosyltransferase exoenzyme [Yersinia thracica]|uniref:NAD(+)--protein-arginine ADP-ribosyltransferase n=1 Tax=Yersinia thracica TaxID=2890319 RepID=A0A0T9PE12_9GAMM|nr:ADP-ribosyltransferase [Yersinia thracica]CNH58386.1 ADP-ribosyltransferase exoenzyme [Yersinia thracica]
MKINHALLILIYIVISIKIVHSRPVEPKYQSNKESFSQYQARHCKWENRMACKEVPEDQGKTPPLTSEDIALDVGLGILTGGPTPQPKGFKFSVGKLPVKPTAKVPTTPKLSTTTERTPLLPAMAKPKAKGVVRRVNGKVGYLLGDPNAPKLGEEPPIKRARVDSSDLDSSSSDISDTSSIKESDAEDDNIQQPEKSKFTIIHRRSPIQESEIEIAIEEIKSIYSEEFWHDTQLDIKDEISGYNKLRTNKEISFQDYFALRDYTEDGYARINNSIRSKNIMPDIKIEIDQLTNALMRHSDINISLKNRSFRNLTTEITDTVYRGEVRNQAEFETQIIEEEIYNNDSFFSTTSDEEYITNFNTEDLNDGEVNVRYTIHYPKGLTYSTDVSALLDNSEETRIFLPDSRFLVTKIEVIGDGTIAVEMRVLRGLQSEFILPPVPIN